jgi:mannose-1-phosphate guanylyltransferase
MEMKVFPLILAGGAGTRLWPLSREEKPKQFLNLSGQETLLGETVKRLLPLEPEMFLIITSRSYESITEAALQRIDSPVMILAEPFPRNTAAAILYGALFLSKRGEDSIMIVLPADHHISDNASFVRVLQKAINTIETDNLITLGLKPTYPETGYGYIKARADSLENDVFPVDRFVEKPDSEIAQRYIDEGNYYWNSGIYIWKTSIILQSFQKLMPDLFNAFAPLRDLEPEQFASTDDKVWSLKKEIFSSVEPISIDYGIMEHAENRLVISCDFGWTDLGSWKSIDDILPHDENMNRTSQPDKVFFVHSKNCSAFPEKGRITVLGLSDIVVVESGDEILVMHKNASQEVRRVVEIIKKREG